jgi:hypothetical protein
MAYLPHDQDLVDLHSDCCADVQAALDARAESGGHRVVGAAFPAITPDLIESAVRNTLDLLVKVAGPSMVNATLAYKAQIRTVVSQAVLQQIDTLVHGLQDAS